MIVRHSSAREVLFDSNTFAADFRRAGESIPDSAVSIQVQDPPEHDVIRRRLAAGYRVSDRSLNTERIRSIVERHLSSVATIGTMDFVADIIEPVAHQVITELLGLRTLSLTELRSCSDSIVNAMDSGLRPEAHEPGIRARDHLTEVIRRPYITPSGDGLISWCRGDQELAELPTPVIVNTLRAMLHAGYSPVSKLLGNALVSLLRAPEAFAFASEDEELTWDLELVRHATPVHAVSRLATTSVSVEGTAIARGESVVVLVAGANRDPDVFEKPHQLRPERDANAALSFGTGIHYCPGASLGRRVLRVMMFDIANRFPRARLLQQPVPCANAVLRGYEAIPVRLS
jgi:cytochrome P450